MTIANGVCTVLGIKSLEVVLRIRDDVCRSYANNVISYKDPAKLQSLVSMGTENGNHSPGMLKDDYMLVPPL